MKPKKPMKAFPRGGSAHDSSVADDKGMDLRDYFAAKAMQAMFTNEVVHAGVLQVAREVGLNEEMALSKMSYAVADAMLKARDE